MIIIRKVIFMKMRRIIYVSLILLGGCHALHSQLNLIGNDTICFENREDYLMTDWLEIVNQEDTTLEFLWTFNVPDTLRSYMFMAVLDFNLHYQWGITTLCGNCDETNVIGPRDTGRIGFDIYISKELPEELLTYVDSLSWDLQSGDCEIKYDQINWKVKSSVATTIEKNNELRIFPNPAHQTITINGVKAGDALILSDMNGHTIFESDRIIGDIDISGIQNGIYFLRIENGDDMRVVRFVKQ